MVYRRPDQILVFDLSFPAPYCIRARHVAEAILEIGGRGGVLFCITGGVSELAHSQNKETRDSNLMERARPSAPRTTYINVEDTIDLVATGKSPARKAQGKTIRKENKQKTPPGRNTPVVTDRTPKNVGLNEPNPLEADVDHIIEPIHFTMHERTKKAFTIIRENLQVSPGPTLYWRYPLSGSCILDSILNVLLCADYDPDKGFIIWGGRDAPSVDVGSHQETYTPPDI